MGGEEQIESYFVIAQMRPNPKLLNASMKALIYTP